jgi:hypothetical protein
MRAIRKFSIRSMARRGMKFYWPLVQFLPARQYCGGRAPVNWTPETRVKCEIGKLKRGGGGQETAVNHR